MTNKFGLDLGALEYEDSVSYPATVPGRTLHVDGDFICYFVTCHEDESWSTMCQSAEVQIETLRLLAGADNVKLHLTGANSTKGGRYGIQREYQGDRKGKEKPKRLEEMRLHLRDKYGAAYWLDQEADDGMSQANYAAIQRGEAHLSVIASKDKDLTMCQGWHLDWNTGELWFVDGFGSVEVDRSKSSAKGVGKGYSFFWLQLLMGDTADNIQGLPKLPGSVLNKIKPTKAVTNALATLQSGTATDKQKASANRTLSKRKDGACGAVTAVALVEKLTSNRQALETISRLYKWYGEAYGFTHWETGKPVDWATVFYSEANMLWMREHINKLGEELDVVRFFREVMEGKHDS